MKNKYPIYIVSKGRWENPLTAKCFLMDGVDFKILVEPQEYKNYCNTLPQKNIIALPFSNLGVGSYPARNYAWEDSEKNGFERHWTFDDNIHRLRRLHKGKRIPCNALSAIKILEEFTDRYTNIGITAFNYQYFVPNTTSKPFYLNVHAYSAMLMKNNVKFRWRLKYNEDVDLCLQFLTNKYCTILFNTFMVDKTSTVAKMKGGNQTELYQNNSHEKKMLKAGSLHDVWPEIVEIVERFNRPHHYVDWKKHFKHSLIRRKDIDWNNLPKFNNFGMELKKIKEIQSEELKDLYETESKNRQTI